MAICRGQKKSPSVEVGESVEAKVVGGKANMKMTRDTNCGLLTQLAWRVLNCSGDVWGHALHAKYGVKEEDGAHFRDKKKSSPIWKGVMWGVELLGK